MLLWYHLGAPPNLYRRSKPACLRQTHHATTIRDLRKASKRANNHTTRHKPTADCTRRHCRADREPGYNNPHSCASLAHEITGSLDPKFDPSHKPPKDGPSLTHRRKEKKQRAIVENGDNVTFDPSITAQTSLDECFRLFGNPNNLVTDPAHRLQSPRLGEGPPENPTRIYTDGSCLNNGKANASCGAAIWLGPNHPMNKAIKVPGATQSNQAGEIAAVVVALQSVPPITPLEIISDSRYVINGLTKHLASWEDAG